MTQFNWIIVSISAYPQADGETDVVFQVNWQCQAISEDGAANTFGSVPVTYTAGSPFTPYDQLTQEQVWGWINPSINRPEIEANLQAMIDAKKNPTVVTPPLPWAQGA
jgi:hypothetical protein